MSEIKLNRVAEDSPIRCQAIAGRAQCQYQAVEGSNFCPLHGGSGLKSRRMGLHNYRLTKYRSSVLKKSSSDEIKSLKEEIGILRLVLEKIINSCESEYDLILQSSKISDLVSKIQSLILACNTLDLKSQNYLDKAQIYNFVDSIVALLSKFLEPDKLITISTEISYMLESNETN